jgi:molybdenum cofactor cytidylyltransferase
VAAIVLAAGGSKRMAQLKQLLPIDGVPMVRRVTEAVCAVGLNQVVVVIGAQASAVETALRGLPVSLTTNKAWDQGLSTSVRAGLRALQPEIQAALLVLADQPGVTPPLMRALVARYRTSRAQIVAPTYQGRRGNPVIFDRALFPELLRARGDQGGRGVIAQRQNQVDLVETGDPAVLLDLDTFDDYVTWAGGQSDGQR